MSTRSDWHWLVPDLVHQAWGTPDVEPTYPMLFGINTTAHLLRLLDREALPEYDCWSFKEIEGTGVIRRAVRIALQHPESDCFEPTLRALLFNPNLPPDAFDHTAEDAFRDVESSVRESVRLLKGRGSVERLDPIVAFTVLAYPSVVDVIISNWGNIDPTVRKLFIEDAIKDLGHPYKGFPEWSSGMEKLLLNCATRKQFRLAQKVAFKAAQKNCSPSGRDASRRLSQYARLLTDPGRMYPPMRSTNILGRRRWRYVPRALWPHLSREQIPANGRDTLTELELSEIALCTSDVNWAIEAASRLPGTSGKAWILLASNPNLPTDFRLSQLTAVTSLCSTLRCKGGSNEHLQFNNTLKALIEDGPAVVSSQDLSSFIWFLHMHLLHLWKPGSSASSIRDMPPLLELLTSLVLEVLPRAATSLYAKGLNGEPPTSLHAKGVLHGAALTRDLWLGAALTTPYTLLDHMMPQIIAPLAPHDLPLPTVRIGTIRHVLASHMVSGLEHHLGDNILAWNVAAELADDWKRSVDELAHVALAAAA